MLVCVRVHIIGSGRLMTRRIGSGLYLLMMKLLVVTGLSGGLLLLLLKWLLWRICILRMVALTLTLLVMVLLVLAIVRLPRWQRARVRHRCQSIEVVDREPRITRSKQGCCLGPGRSRRTRVRKLPRGFGLERDTACDRE